MAVVQFRKYQPLGLRIWHWLNALAILGLLLTVLLRKTFLSWRTNSALIEAKLQAAGTAITPELAK
ncbi:MAG: cytochrome b/b6 domain-containing protein, partial [Bdellovibrio sp.]